MKQIHLPAFIAATTGLFFTAFLFVAVLFLIAKPKPQRINRDPPTVLDTIEIKIKHTPSGVPLHNLETSDFLH
jgi:hypothetical protein